MREIKFRAFDKKNNKYIYSGIEYELEALSLTFSKKRFVSIGFAKEEHDRFFIEQFTGLHDSTLWEELMGEEREKFLLDGNVPSEWIGKEIYEGDIGVSTTDGKIEVVEWNVDGHFCVCSNKHPSGYGTSDAWATHFKILGNIHQHSHLLED